MLALDILEALVLLLVQGRGQQYLMYLLVLLEQEFALVLVVQLVQSAEVRVALQIPQKQQVELLVRVELVVRA